MDLEGTLLELAKLGCFPCLSFRGKVWRAHINACGNQWEEGKTPVSAFRKALKQWKAAGKPMDGLAVSPRGIEE